MHPQDTRRFPFPLPSGWFAVAYGDELPIGTVRREHYFGREIVLFRTESGRAAVVDAFCPHLGAHLAVGGEVMGESIRCPFHGWRFATDGSCVDAPYASKKPSAARLGTMPTAECNGMIWAWYAADGSEPTWQVPVVEEYDDPDWGSYNRRDWVIRTRNQEIAENSADPVHLQVVHGLQTPRPEMSFVEHEFRSVTRYGFESKTSGVGEAYLEVRWLGLGISITRSCGTADSLIFGTCTPIDDGSVHHRFSVLLNRAQGLTAERGLGKKILDETWRQMEQDIPIWENKAFLERPGLCDGDGPIGKFRNWARRFYDLGGEDRG